MMKKIITVSILLIFLFGCNPKPPSIEEIASEIHTNVFTVDSHADTPWSLLRGDFDLSERHDYSIDRSRVDFPRMREGGLDAIFMAAFVGQRERNEEGNQKAFEKVDLIIDSLYTHLSTRNDEAKIVGNPYDAYQLEKENKRSIFIGIENGYAIGNDLKKIDYFYNKGARYITLCHTKNNDICDSSTDSIEHSGLSKFGASVIVEMNRLGMMIDVSHISDSSFYDVIQISDKPVIASHSCAWSLCDNPRNLKDDMLKQLAINGGVVQMCILSDYVKNPEPYPERDSAKHVVREKYRNFDDLTPEEMKMARRDWYAVDTIYPAKLATVSDMVDHIDHMVGVAGIDHVGIGTDFDGGGGLSDCQDVSQMGNITLELVKRGYSEAEIRKIWGGNLMRVMNEVQQMGS